MIISNQIITYCIYYKIYIRQQNICNNLYEVRTIDISLYLYKDHKIFEKVMHDPIQIF